VVTAEQWPGLDRRDAPPQRLIADGSAHRLGAGLLSANALSQVPRFYSPNYGAAERI